MSASRTKRVVIFAALLLAGCAVDGLDISVATDICKDHGGIQWLWGTSDSVTCRDGFKADYESIKRKLQR